MTRSHERKRTSTGEENRENREVMGKKKEEKGERKGRNKKKKRRPVSQPEIVV